MSRSRRILILDHDNGLLDLLGGLLRDEGHQPLIGSCPDSIADAAATQGPDLAILDLQVFHQARPDIAVLDLIQHNPAVAGMPILLTATDPSLLQRTVAGLQRAHTDWIAKPFDLEELLRKIDLLLAELG